MTDTPVAVKDVQIVTFRTRSELRGESIVVEMSGNADMAAQEELRAFLDALHTEALRVGVRETVFELEALYFMNSSCLSLLLRQVNAVGQLPADQNYRMTFRVNRNLRWQRRSLQALCSYAPNIVTVE